MDRAPPRGQRCAAIAALGHRLHLAVDLAVGVLFLILPYVLGFEGVDAAFYRLNGGAVVTVIARSKPETAPIPA